MTSTLLKGKRGKQRQKLDDKDTGSHQTLKEERDDAPLELSEGAGDPADIGISDFRPPEP